LAPPSPPRGFSLLELLIGMFLTALLTAAVTSLLGGSVSAYRQQLSQGQLEASSRFAREILEQHVSQAGFNPQPWQNPAGRVALTSESANHGLRSGDQLGLQRWSDHNCYGNQNPVTDADGLPEFHLLQTRFEVTPANNLAMTCRYGPDITQLTTQVNNFGLVENVESMQVLYAQDRDDDGAADGWVQAGDWQRESRVLAVRIALLFVSERAFSKAEARIVTMLDESITTPADGHLRVVSTLTTAIRGRLK
jgi:type IV pilus assembly protein PilW